MAKTSVEVDPHLLRQASAILGTRTLRETVDRSLREVIDARRRVEMVELLRQEGRFDFDAVPHAWGGEEQ